MFITTAQVRAARALLDWNQSDLAQHAGLSKDHVANYELERSKSLDVLEKIYTALTTEGIVFTEGEGVRKRNYEIRVLQGREGFAEFRADVLSDARLGPLDVCVSNVDEVQFEKWGSGKVNDDYRAGMAKIDTLRFRILIKENDKFLTGARYAAYRWLPEELFGEISFYVYGNKVAIISFIDDDFHAFIIGHSAIAGFYRKDFNRLWGQAHDIGQAKG